MEPDDFVTSKQAVTFAFRLEDRLFQWDLGHETEKKHVLFIAPTLRGGFATLTEKPDGDEDVDTVNSFFGGGFRIGDDYTGIQDADDKPYHNPPLIRSVDVLFGQYENFGDNRWTFDALLMADTSSGFFLGAQAIVGEGKDDVRVYAGFSLSLKALSEAVGSLGRVL